MRNQLRDFGEGFVKMKSIIYPKLKSFLVIPEFVPQNGSVVEIKSIFVKDMKREVHLRDLGVLDYQTVWDLQHDLFQQAIDTKIHNRRNQTKTPTTNHFLLVEHNPVITLGKFGSADHLLTSKAELEAKGISFFKIDRGGDITYHGPGQIVGYPILDLDHFFTDIHKYLRLLEQVIIDTLADFEIIATRSQGETGVWLDVNTPFARKICAMGIRASRWVTMHGFSLNVNTNLSHFDHIVPCGIHGKQVTSIAQELAKEVSLSEVKKRITHHFQKQFDATLVR
jgi:lipoyl(octanoyl) transferase